MHQERYLTGFQYEHLLLCIPVVTSSRSRHRTEHITRQQTPPKVGRRGRLLCATKDYHWLHIGTEQESYVKILVIDDHALLRAALHM